VELGSFISGLLTGLREGVEAALIVSIILAYLVRTGNGRSIGRIWVGVGLAIALSATLGVVLYATVGSLPSPYEQWFEGATMLLAAAVVTWMLFWMRRQAASVSGELRAAVDRALGEGSLLGLTALAFVAVIREGVETALFLVGQASAASIGDGARGALAVLVGALVGLAIAVGLGYGFYRGSRRIDLAAFFRWTGVALIFIAAGLVASAVHEFVEAGALTVGTATLFDISRVLPHDPEAGNPLGMLLHALFGYTSTPEVVTFLAWAGYLTVVLTLYLRPVRRRLAVPAERPNPTAATNP
jgi:high-affinity iron transporter